MNNKENTSYRDKIATVDDKGKRIWIYPKMPKGIFYNKRKLLGYSLLALLFIIPFIKIGGEPLLLLNVIERKFIIFGKVFWPQDFHIFAIAMITGVIFITLFTVVFGRLFCGWVCPQTIFMELIFRRIEYWIEGDWTHQKKLNKAPWNQEKILKKTLKHSIFWLISFLIANTFLMYFIGYEQLFEIITDSPSNHIVGLVAIVIFTTIFYAVFAFMREQVCTTVCPYGRLQGVLLDRDSMIISYDYKRGENRGKFKKNENREEEGKGDCIDCMQCVHVCPTGIDIRNGTQLECVNCTACIDACDSIMESIGKPKGLIKYASEESISKRIAFHFTKRAKSYTVLLFLLTGLLTTLIVTRSDFEMTVSRTQGGKLYHDMGDGTVSNIYDISIVNKTNDDIPFELKILDGEGNIKLIGNDSIIKGQDVFHSSFMIIMKESEINKMKTKFRVGAFSNGVLIDNAKAIFIGPIF